MRLVVHESDAIVSDVFCDRDPVQIGSGDDCAVRLPADLPAYAGSIHATDEGHALTPADGGVVAILVNGAAIDGRVLLRAGDEVRVGSVVIEVMQESTEAAWRPEITTSVAHLTRFAQTSQLPPGSLVKRTDEAIGVQPLHVQRIGQVNLKLASCITPEQIMEVALEAIQSAFSPQRVWIGIRRVNYGVMEYVQGRTNSGQSADLPEAGEKLKPRVLDRAQFVLIQQWTPDERLGIMTGPFAGPDGTLGMIYLDGPERRFAPADLDYLILLSNTLAVQLDAVFRYIAQNRAAMLAGEISVAHEIQARLTPKKLPQWEDVLQIGAFREPGREHTGDIYDVVKLASGHAAIMIANTPATGPLPSMLMAQAHAAFRVAAMHQDPPHVFLRSLNHVLFDPARDRLLNCFVGLIDPAEGTLRYAMAGTTGAFIIGLRGEERALAPSPAEPMLGDTRAPSYSLRNTELESSETLVLFTPGVVTAKSRAGEVFGQDRFVNFLCDGFGQLASQLLKEMLADLRSFTEGGLQPDDITVILAHRV
ncbi:MAG: SpoIIE family protein phosphatase [Phycisphaerales bacterium]|nr:SpoIIE family protein phosphatase [Phycisphaerales bacterium]